MLEILLIRHGQTAWNKERRIMGALPVPLDPVGRRQSRALARFLREVPIDACYSSPTVRALETARLIVGRRRIPLTLASEMIEIDYGEWVGKHFDEVMRQPAYLLYHSTPKKSRPPGGENMTGVWRRAIGFIEKIRKKHRKGRVLVVSHADVIKTILAHYVGLDLNSLQRFRVDNASLSYLWFNKSLCRLLAVNQVGEMRRLFLPSLHPRKKTI